MIDDYAIIKNVRFVPKPISETFYQYSSISSGEVAYRTRELAKKTGTWEGLSMKAIKDRDKEKQSPDRVEKILEIADRVRERTTPETFETVFNAVLRITYPKL